MSNQREPGRWIVVVCLLGLAAVLYLRLIPFGFIRADHIPFERVTWHPLTFRDVPLNILLFIPLGFGLTGLMVRRGRQIGIAGRVVLAAALLSAALEAAQLFMPDRAPSFADIAANAVGALLGYGLFRVREMGFGRALDRYVTRRNLLIGLAGYALGVALLTGYLRWSVNLSNWNTGFPLVIGNEAVGKRQWSGRVMELALRAGGDSPQFYATYNLDGQAPYQEVSHPPSLPPLEWQEGTSSPDAAPGVVFGPGNWLATNQPVTPFSSTARNTSGFIIDTQVASTDQAQRGPARIISISADAERRNVTIGQEFDALVIRLRTPAGGENGQKPEVLVPGVFADKRPKHIIVSYVAPMLRVTVDDKPYALSLAPGAAFFPGFSTANRWPVDMTSNPNRYDQAYWGIVTGMAALLFGGLAIAKQLGRK